jgi:hypothetical protein
MQTLRTSDYEQFKDRNPERLEGTCKWILRHENFRNWRDSNSACLLWVTADPGCGKSVLCRSLIENDFRSTESITTCYFFFKDDNELQRNINSALSALLHQLFSQKRRLLKHAMEEYVKNRDFLPQSFHTLWEIFTKAVTDPLAGKIVCILDGLDECTVLGRNQIIGTLRKFYKNPTSRSASQLKFLVTSRPYFDIERQFSELVRLFPAIRLHGERESNGIASEINIFTKSEVEKLSHNLDLSHSERITLESELLNVEHRTYLWPKLIVEVIRDEISITRAKLMQIIRTLPATVDEAYESILSRVRERDKNKVKKLLHLIVVATRPLTLKEMNIALNIEGNHRNYDDLDLESSARFESSLRNLCGFFVTVVNQKVYLIHESAKEFLIRKNETITGLWKHSLDPVESELVMAKVCVTYLMLSLFDGPVNYFSTASILDFFDYAAEFWALHFRKAQHRATPQLVQSVIKVCNAQTPRFQAWFDTYWYTNHPQWPTPQFTDALIISSYFGFEVVVRRLLELGTLHPNSIDEEYRRTPLLWAAEEGHAGVVRLLLETGAVDVNWCDEHDQTPLGVAAERGHEDVVELLLATQGVDVWWRDKFSQTAQSWAKYNRHDAVAMMIGAAPPSIDPDSDALNLHPVSLT